MKETDIPVELGSDQTSLHNPFNGGYYPVQISFEGGFVSVCGCLLIFRVQHDDG